jgi:hypothetical protein
MNNPTLIPGASPTPNWRKEVESIAKRCVCALALILLFTAVAVGIGPSRKATAQESSPTTTLSSQPNADGWGKDEGTLTLRRHKAH